VTRGNRFVLKAKAARTRFGDVEGGDRSIDLIDPAVPTVAWKAALFGHLKVGIRLDSIE
jgi:hypothetical protein